MSARIYIVCDSSEGVDYAIGIQAVYLDRAEAIAKCEELGRGYWVWEFREGQSYGEAIEVWPRHTVSPPESGDMSGWPKGIWDSWPGGAVSW